MKLRKLGVSIVFTIKTVGIKIIDLYIKNYYY